MRYLVSDIIGTGARTDPYRLRVSNYAGTAAAYLIPTDPNTGTPTSKWGLAAVRDADWLLLSQDPNMTAFPNVDSSTLFGSLGGSDRNKVRNWMSAQGIAPAPANTETLAQIIQRIGQSLDPNFDVALFTVD